MSISVSKEELLQLINSSTIEELYQTYDEKIISLHLDDRIINFTFNLWVLKNEQTSEIVELYSISLLWSSLDEIAELRIHGPDQVEVYAMKYHKYHDVISFDQIMEDLHLLAGLFGFKELYLFDHAEKMVHGQTLPVSLIRKLAGKSYFYQKYGYKMKDDIKEIEQEFEDFCLRKFNTNSDQITIRHYFSFIDQYRTSSSSEIFTNVLNHIFSMPDNKALFEMQWAIKNYPFYKEL